MKILQSALQDPGQIDLIAAVLLGLILLTCLLCLFMLFFYAGRVRSYGLHQKIIFDTIKDRKVAEDRVHVDPLRFAQAEIRDDIAQLETTLDSTKDEKKARELKEQIGAKRQDQRATEQKIREMEAEIEREANQYAKSILPASISLSEQFGPYFYIEFGTVIVIIFALLGLAIIKLI